MTLDRVRLPGKKFAMHLLPRERLPGKINLIIRANQNPPDPYLSIPLSNANILDHESHSRRQREKSGSQRRGCCTVQ